MYHGRMCFYGDGDCHSKFQKKTEGKSRPILRKPWATLEKYLQGCVTDNIIDHVPNAKTLEAMDKCEEMIKNPEKYPSHHSMDELLATLELDDE